LQVASIAQLNQVILEIDSTEVGAKLLRDGQDQSIYSALVDEIKTLLTGFEAFKVRTCGD
jgi:hypothetical protein